MWYIIVRFFFFAILFIVFFKTFKRHLKKITVIVSIIVTLILFSFSYLVPFENLFFNFSSPQDVFRYQLMGKPISIVEGKDSALILYINNGTISQSIIPKTKNGWKIGTYFSYEGVLTKDWKYNTIVIYRCKNSSDFYVFVSDPLAKKFEDISDNKDSSFYHYSNESYYSYVYGIDKDYTLTINGEKITFNFRPKTLLS